jgi:hypothetical protein
MQHDGISVTIDEHAIDAANSTTAKNPTRGCAGSGGEVKRYREEPRFRL